MSGSSQVPTLMQRLSARFKGMLNKCVNLTSLTLTTPGAPMKDSMLAEAFAPDLSLTSLRYVSLQINMKDPVYEFIQRHAPSLRGVDLNYAPPRSGRYQIVHSPEIAARYPTPLPPSCPIYCGSPILVPVYVPDSYVEDVCLSWYVQDVYFDAFAPTLVRALSRSKMPIKTISYFSYSWNFAFTQMAALRLHGLEVLELQANLKRDAGAQMDRKVLCLTL